MDGSCYTEEGERGPGKQGFEKRTFTQTKQIERERERHTYAHAQFNTPHKPQYYKLYFN